QEVEEPLLEDQGQDADECPADDDPCADRAEPTDHAVYPIAIRVLPVPGEGPDPAEDEEELHPVIEWPDQGGKREEQPQPDQPPRPRRRSPQEDCTVGEEGGQEAEVRHRGELEEERLRQVERAHAPEERWKDLSRDQEQRQQWLDQSVRV